MTQLNSEMDDLEEKQKRKILRFLGDKFKESGDDFYSEKTISQNCNIAETEVKNICLSLEKEGLIQNGKKSGKDYSYKIAMDGLVLLETYFISRTPEAMALSKFKEIAKLGFDKMHKMNSELQEGVVEVGQKHHLKDGLYYFVLIDISGSTLSSSKMNGSEFHEWVMKFIRITKDALNTRKRNLCVFVKSIGDGALFLFRNFNDILDWKNVVDESCKYHNDSCIKAGKLDFHQYHHKTIIHLGEVYFDRENYDTNAFGINIVFKVEKKFGKDEIGITEAVKQIILPEINAGKFKISDADKYSFDENEDAVIPLWKLTIIG